MEIVIAIPTELEEINKKITYPLILANTKTSFHF